MPKSRISPAVCLLAISAAVGWRVVSTNSVPAVREDAAAAVAVHEERQADRTAGITDAPGSPSETSPGEIARISENGAPPGVPETSVMESVPGKILNPVHGFAADWQEDGSMVISPSTDRSASGLKELDAVSAGVTLRMAGMGSGMVAASGRPGGTRPSGDGWEADRPGITEWYRPAEGGMEHGFTVEQRPVHGALGNPLEIALEVQSGLRAVMWNPDTIVFQDDFGAMVWAYRHLVVYDAKNRTLPSWMRLRADKQLGKTEILLCFNDAGATYPVTVDPTFSSTEVAPIDSPQTFGERSSAQATMDGVLGDDIFFAADDGVYGSQLWKTNSITGETSMLGTASRGPFPIKAYKGFVWFWAADDENVRHLWRSDGTPEGTQLFRNFSPSEIVSYPKLMEAGGFLYFNIFNPAQPPGDELWRTDGTPQGTTRVIARHRPMPDFERAVVLGNQFIYPTDSAVWGREIWRSDGTEAGTVLLKDIWPGESGSSPGELKQVGEKVFFVARSTPEFQGGLWVTDGTESGTLPISPEGAWVGGPTLVRGNEIYYIQSTDAEPCVLWKSDGTPQGTAKIRTITTLQNNAVLMGADSTFVYFVQSLLSESWLWRSDGTTAGTVRFKEFEPRGIAGWPANTPSAGRFVFTAETASAGHELWTTDGTEEGTVMVRDILPGVESSSSLFLGSAGKMTYFNADDGAHGFELWRTDGTAEGTAMVQDIHPGGLERQRPADMTIVGGNVFFSAHGRESGRELWKSDGTADGTRLVYDALAGEESSFASGTTQQFSAAGDLLFYVANNQRTSSIWRSDGTVDGTLELKSPSYVSDPPGYSKSNLIPFGESVLFNEVRPSESRLFISDGTAAGTVPLGPGGNAITPLSPGLGLFFASGTDGASRIWRTDGTPAGTSQLFPDSFAAFTLQGRIPVVNGLAYFAGNDNVLGHELWVTDGTTAGTRMVADLTPGAGGTELSSSHATANRLFFTTRISNTRYQLWCTDGSTAGTIRLRELRKNDFYQAVASAAALGDTLVFTTDDGVRGMELWRSDGTPAGTIPLGDINPGSESSFPEGMVPLGNRMIFTALKPSEGFELRVTDGTPQGTILLKDIRLGPKNSGVTHLGNARGRAWFAATDGLHGRELWVTDGTPAGTVLAEDLVPGYPSSQPIWVGEVSGKILVMYDRDPATGGFGVRELIITPAPVLQIGIADNILSSSATLRGYLDPDEAGGTYQFEYGTSTEYGLTTPARAAGQAGDISAEIGVLEPGRTYHFRIVLITGSGPVYSQDQTFRTASLRVFAGTDTNAPEISSGQSGFVYYPDTPEGSKAARDFTVENASSESVTLTGSSLPQGYLMEGATFPQTLEAGETLHFQISLLSPVPGTFTGNFILESEAGSFSFPLSTVVLLVNDPPVIAAAAARIIPEDTILKGKLEATDPDNQPLVFSLVGSAINGTAIILPDGSYTFTPSLNFSGMASFTVKTNDGLIDSEPVTVSIEILPVPDPPVLMNLPLLGTAEDTPVSGNLSATSAEGRALTYAMVTGPLPATGSLMLTANGAFTFTPTANYSGPAVFTAKASDGTLDSNIILTAIYVTPVNDPPSLAMAAGMTAVSGLPAPAISMALNDVDSPAGTLTLTTETSDPGLLPLENILITGTGPARNLTVSPPLNAEGNAVVTITLTDGGNTATRNFDVRILRNVIEISRPSPSGVSLRFTGIPGRTYQIQRSADMKTWLPMVSLPAVPSGQIIWNDTTAPPAKAFYQLAEP